jgi:hypothetical protein
VLSCGDLSGRRSPMILCTESVTQSLIQILNRYQLTVVSVENDAHIPGSYWGESEAGLIDNQLYIRPDTPLHSALHEACHFICMDPHRRDVLDTDAGGDFDEENAVCYLQILLADHFSATHRKQMCADMDDWGYTFRLGSAQAWFEKDATDAKSWLLRHHIIDHNDQITWQMRQ